MSFYELDRLIQAFSQVPALVKNGMFERAAVQKTFILSSPLPPSSPGSARQVLKRAASAAAAAWCLLPLRPLTHCRKSQQSKGRKEAGKSSPAFPSTTTQPQPAGPPLCPALSSLTAPVRFLPSIPLHATPPPPAKQTRCTFQFRRSKNSTKKDSLPLFLLGY